MFGTFGMSSNQVLVVEQVMVLIDHTPGSIASVFFFLGGGYTTDIYGTSFWSQLDWIRTAHFALGIMSGTLFDEGHNHFHAVQIGGAII